MKNCLEWEHSVNWEGQHLPETCIHWRIDSNKYFSGAIYQIIFHSKKKSGGKDAFYVTTTKQFIESFPFWKIISSFVLIKLPKHCIDWFLTQCCSPSYMWEFAFYSRGNRVHDRIIPLKGEGWANINSLTPSCFYWNVCT